MTGLNGWAAAQSLAAKSTNMHSGGRGESRTEQGNATGQSATHSLGPLLCQDIQRQLVGLAVEVFEQSVVEDGVVRAGSQK